MFIVCHGPLLSSILFWSPLFISASDWYIRLDWPSDIRSLQKGHHIPAPLSHAVVGLPLLPAVHKV
jgi:hypothetical protein